MSSGFTIGSIANYVWSTACDGDGLCSYAIKCLSCSGSYILIEGKCVSLTSCRKYALFNSTASAFSYSECYCKPGFYQVGVASCELCHSICSSCSGPANTDCIDCIEGYYLNGGVCTTNSTYYSMAVVSVIPNPGTGGWTTTTSPASPTAKTSGNNCASSAYTFGYYGYTITGVFTANFQTAKIDYTITQATMNAKPSKHYGFHFKATFLFIDKWSNGQKIYFRANGESVYTYVYDMESIVGEELCGRADHDHHEYV